MHFQAVKHLHDHNLVHMDIKPDNIFISVDGVCKLGDFGLVLDMSKVKHKHIFIYLSNSFRNDCIGCLTAVKFYSMVGLLFTSLIC